MKIQMLGEGLLYQVERNRQRMIASMERRKAVAYTLAMLVCCAIFIWNCYR